MPRRALSPEHNLAVKFPEVAAQWNYLKNGDLTPEDVTLGMKKKVWWICDKGHVWEARVSNRTRGHGCPECAGKYASPEHNLAVKFPEIAAQWHPTMNGDLTPANKAPGYIKKPWWKCRTCGHEWSAHIKNITQGGPKCKVCRANNRNQEYVYDGGSTSKKRKEKKKKRLKDSIENYEPSQWLKDLGF